MEGLGLSNHPKKGSRFIQLAKTKRNLMINYKIQRKIQLVILDDITLTIDGVAPVDNITSTN